MPVQGSKRVARVHEPFAGAPPASRILTSVAHRFVAVGDSFTEGVGDWDESTSEQPYWQWRATEVAKVRRVRESRQVTVENLMLAAAYCKACGYDVRDATWLYRHIRDAIRWEKASHSDATINATQLETQITTAVTEAYAAGEMDWVARLTNANGTTNRTEALNAWQHR